MLQGSVMQGLSRAFPEPLGSGVMLYLFVSTSITPDRVIPLGREMLYIACHGSGDALHFPNGTQLSVSDLGSIIEQVNSGTQIDGIFLGSCLIGTNETARRLLTSQIAAPQRVKWVAGYTTTVSWFDATLLDVLFLRSLLLASATQPPRQAVEHALETIKTSMSGLASESEFYVYVRRQRSGNIINIGYG